MTYTTESPTHQMNACITYSRICSGCSRHMDKLPPIITDQTKCVSMTESHQAVAKLIVPQTAHVYPNVKKGTNKTTLWGMEKPTAHMVCPKSILGLPRYKDICPSRKLHLGTSEWSTQTYNKGMQSWNPQQAAGAQGPPSQEARMRQHPMPPVACWSSEQ